jgi:hypothetical protein
MTLDKGINSTAYIIKRLVLFCLIFILLLLVFAPWSFRMPENGLEPSWVAVLNEAFAKNWKWGKDIAFTYGPYGFLILRQFHPRTWFFQFIFWFFVLFIFSLNLFKRFSHLPSILALILAGLFSLTVLYSGNTFFYCIPLIVGFNYEFNESFQKNLDIYFLVALSGLGALIKFSFAPFPFIFYLLMDAYVFLKKDKIPLLTLLFIGTIIISFLVLNFSIKDFLNYLSLSNAFSKSYGTAMQLEGPSAEIFEFFTASFLILISWVLLNGRSFFSPNNLIIFSGLLFCLLITQKASFVRHDSHGLISWNALLLCSLFYLAYIWKNFHGSLVRFYICILVAMNFFLFLKWYKFYWQSSYFQIALNTPYQSLVGNLNQLNIFVTNPQKYINEVVNDYENTISQIKESSALPKLNGSVDIIPSNQIEVIANNLNYHPRPIFQSYTAHAPILIRKNREFFASLKAPQNLIFGLDDIDGRYPGSSEGGTWLEFFKHYDPVSSIKTNLLLKRRTSERRVSLHPIGNYTLSFDEKLDVSKHNALPLWAVVEFEENLLGKVIGFLFKNPIVFAKVILEGNKSERFRIVPPISMEGQLISPIIRDDLDFANLFFENGSTLRERLNSLRFQTSRFGKKLYSKIKIHLYSLTLSQDFEHEIDSNFSNFIFSRKILNSLKMINGIFNIQYSNDKYIAFAHAPTDLKLPIPSNVKKLKISLGLIKGAWEDKGMTDGVCFRISYFNDQNNLLLNKCLEPKTKVNDREEMTYEIDLQRPGVDLVLSTTCNGNCYWDWSYWTNLAFIQ